MPIAGKEEVVVSYRRLLELERHGILQDYVEGLDDFVNVSDLLEGAGAGRPYVFISYASKDTPMVREIIEGLMKRDVRVLVGEQQLRPGNPWWDTIKEIRAKCRAAVVCVGASGIDDLRSKQVRELQHGRAMTKHEGEVFPLIPVLLPGAATEVEWPVFLRGRNWNDFRDGLDEVRLNQLVRVITGIKAKNAGP